MIDAKFIVITSARNEADYLGKAIESIVSQTRLPNEWVIVDDGSTDATAYIAEKASQSYPWMRVVRCEDRGYRKQDFGMVEAFYYGINHLITDDFDFIFLIDADVLLKPKYFEVILLKYLENSLGMAEGEVYEYKRGKFTKVINMPWSTSGLAKCWRRKCFEEIGGIVKAPGWDIIDNYKAMMLGWQTKTFEDEELKILHLRPSGWSFKSIYHASVRSGKDMYFRGTHPVWLVASAFYNMLDYPYIIKGFCIIMGYIRALFEGSEQYNDEKFRKWLWKWQLDKIIKTIKTLSMQC